MARLLIASQPVSGGVAVCVSQQTRAALERGYDVVVACPPSRRGPLADWVRASGADHVELDMTRSPGPSDLAHALALRRLMVGVDLVHAHSSKAGALTRVAAMTTGSHPPVVFTPHAWSWLVGGRMSMVYRTVERLLAPATDVFIAVGEGEAIEGRAAIPGSEMRVVPNGVDVDLWSPDGPVAPRQPEPLVVCVGRLSRQKGQDLAIAALARMTRRDVVLRLVGDGPARADLTRLAFVLGVLDRVEFMGSVSDPDKHLRAADVVIVPSRWDGMSLALLEAMAVGSAIVATEVAGTEVLGDAGILVPVEDVTGLTTALDELVDDESRRRDLARAARAASLDHALEDSLQAVVSVWQDTLARRGHTS